jgi:hypothetical protein
MYEGLPRVSTATFFFKRVFPALWFGFLSVFAVGIAFAKPLFIIHPLVMMTFGYFLFRKLVWDLADEVLDGGTYLLVRHGELAVRIELRDVMNVNFNQLSNPRRVTLRLRAPNELGDEVTFIPIRSVSFNPFARNAFVDALIVRVDAARSQR